MNKLKNILLFIFFFLFLLRTDLFSFDWTHTARIIGAEIFTDETIDEIHKHIDDYAKQNVSVILIWAGNFGNYQWNEEDFSFLKEVARYTHNNYPKMKVIVYIAPLEQQTYDVDMDRDGKIDPGKESFYTRHPDWVQTSIDGRKAVFYGKIAIWLEDTWENVWISPNIPEYRKIWVNILKEITRTGVDGIWWDVPFYIYWFGDNWDGEWTDFCDNCDDYFYKYSGYSLPEKEDWENPVWRRFIDWRFKTMSDFIKECKNAAQKINPKFKFINEAWDDNTEFLTQVGFSANYARLNQTDDSVAHECGSNEPSDYFYYNWLLDIAEQLVFRGVDQKRASWVLSYSETKEHAKTRGFSHLFSGCNFYEVNYPDMNSTVGFDTRTDIFKWIKDNEEYLYSDNLKNLNKTAVLYSFPTYKYYGLVPDENIYKSLLGTIMILLESHIDFEVLPNDLLERLSNYKTLILPFTISMSKKNIEKIKTFVENGGKLIATGSDIIYNESGDKFNDSGIEYICGEKPEKGRIKVLRKGRGKCIITKDKPAINFYDYANPMYGNESESEPEKAENIRKTYIEEIYNKTEIKPLIKTNAPSSVLFNVFTDTENNRLIIRVVNLKGLKAGNFSPTPVNNINISFYLSDKLRIESAEQIEFLNNKNDLSYTIEKNDIIKTVFNIKRGKFLIFNTKKVKKINPRR